MAGHRAGGQPIPVIPVPAEFVNGRGERERRVGHAAGDHDRGPRLQRVDNGSGPEIGVRADDRARGWKPAARRCPSWSSACPAASSSSSRGSRSSPDTVAMIRSANPARSRRPRALAAQAAGFMPPALVMILSSGCAWRTGTESSEDIEKIGGVTSLGVALLLQRQDRHGQLGEVLQRQIMELAVLWLVEPAHRGYRPKSHSRCRCGFAPSLCSMRNSALVRSGQ